MDSTRREDGSSEIESEVVSWMYLRCLISSHPRHGHSRLPLGCV